MKAIKTVNLSHSYYKNFWDKKKLALDTLNLEVDEGEIFGFLGANGAGKTTTIKILVGLQKPSKGEASIFSLPVNDIASRKLIGFMPENPYFYEYLTARESLDFFAALCDLPKNIRKHRASELLEFVGLQHASDTRVKEFSKGMRQRLGIAQAIVHNPKLVILDEPMSGLDPVGRHQVREAILNLSQNGTTIFFSTHILSDVEMICTRVGLLSYGKMIACGRIDELLKAQDQEIEIGAEDLSDDISQKITVFAKRIFTQGKNKVFVFSGWDKADEAIKIINSSKAHLTLLRPIKESLEEYFMRTNSNQLQDQTVEVEQK